MSLFVVIALLATQTGVAAEEAKPNVFPTMASFVAPAMFEQCKRIDLDLAGSYDVTLEGWQDRNHAAIEAIKPMLDQQIEEDGISALEHLRRDAAEAVSDFNALPADKQLPGCRRMIAYVAGN